jgi:hypothetical protein
MKIMEKIPVWGDHEEKTLAQIRTCAATADRAALMADGHLGYAVPIGGVVAYKDAISPSGVGFDIACGKQGRSSRYAGTRAAREDRHHHGRSVGDVELRYCCSHSVTARVAAPRVASEAARSPIDRLPLEAKIEWIGEHVLDTKLRR